MNLYFFVEGPLLQAVFFLFLTGLLIRMSFFIAATLKIRKNPIQNPAGVMSIFGGSLLPFHKAFRKKPSYITLRYIFHFCLFAVPIGLSGHIVLWSESRLEWEWPALPDALADWMTIVVLMLTAYFFGRRMLSADTRRNTSLLDMMLIVITALPFLTGYFLIHDTFHDVAILGNHMATIHMLSGEAMILMALFLFYGTRLNAQKCTGCASCAQNCPTETLKYYDRKGLRIFDYAHFRCICCGSCVNVCPENAAELRHEINAKRFAQIFKKREINIVKLETCERCGKFFAPEPQMEKIGTVFAYDYVHCCPNCRKIDIGERLHQLSPWHKRAKTS